MGNVTDLAGGDRSAPAILTETSAGGIFGGRLLGEDPLVEYLTESEQPQYVLRNKKRGLNLDRDGEKEGIEPHSDLQALCVATDVRLLVVVGQETGDESVSIPLSEVVSVDVEEGILGGELVVVTAAEERYGFPCRGSLGQVATYVDEGSQAWARAYTLQERVESRLAEARHHSEDEDFAAATSAVDEARGALADARDRLAAFGRGALATIEGELEAFQSEIAERRRAVHKAHGEHALTVAREHWERREYDAAYDSYATAEEAFERATTVREDEELAERLERVREEWANLKVAPVAYAEAMASEARDASSPATAAQCWEVAVERYRDVYALDWGRDERRFDVEVEGVRERILEILSAAASRRIEAAREARTDAEELRENGAPGAARDRLEGALEGVERTLALAEELRRDGHEELGAERDAIEAELAAIETETEMATATA